MSWIWIDVQEGEFAKKERIWRKNFDLALKRDERSVL
jgi:hypothetical protein